MDLTNISEFDSSFNPTFPSFIKHIDVEKVIHEAETKYRKIREQLPRGPTYSMKSEIKRLRSLQNLDPLSSWSPKELASAGFFYTGLENSNQCFCCGLVLCRQGLSYTPIERHRYFNPECEFVKGGDCGNISKYEIHPRPMKIDQSTDQRMKQDDQRESMKDEQSRLQSFSHWPAYAVLQPTVLAEAGFFFTGIRDLVQCFSCMGCLAVWEEEDDPWKEHAKWFPECEYLNSRNSENKLECKAKGSIPNTSNKHSSLLEKVEILKKQLIEKYTNTSFYTESPFQDSISIDLKACFADISICLKDTRNRPVRQLLLPDILPDLTDITMIEGEAGSGKTALLKKIAILWASGKCPLLDRFSLVFYITLSNSEKQHGLGDIVCQQLIDSVDCISEDCMEAILKNLKDKALFLLDDYGMVETIPTAIEDLILRNPWNGVSLAITVSTDKSWKIRQYARNILNIQRFPLYSTLYLVKNILSHDNEYLKEFVMKLEFSKNLTTILKTPLMILAHCSAKNESHEYSTFDDVNLFKTYLKYSLLKYPAEKENAMKQISLCGELALKGLFQSQFQFSENDLKAAGLDIDKAIQFGLLNKFTAQRLQSVYCFFDPSFLEFLAGKRLSELLESDIPEDQDKGLHYLHQVNTFLKLFGRYSYFMKYACRISTKTIVKIMSYLLSLYDNPGALDCHLEKTEHLKQHPELELEEEGFIIIIRKQMNIDISTFCMHKLLTFTIEAAIESQCLSDCAPIFMQFLTGRTLTLRVPESPIFKTSESILTFLEKFPESLTVLQSFIFELSISSKKYKQLDVLDVSTLKDSCTFYGVPTVENEYSSAYLSLSNRVQKTDENISTINNFFSLFPTNIEISDSVISPFLALRGKKVPKFRLMANDINSTNMAPDEIQKLAILLSTSDNIELSLNNCKDFVQHIFPAIKGFLGSFKQLALDNTHLTAEEQDQILEMSSLESLWIVNNNSLYYPESLISGIHRYFNLTRVYLCMPGNPEVLDHLPDEFRRLDRIQSIGFFAGDNCEVESVTRFVQFFKNFQDLNILLLRLGNMDCAVLMDSLASCKKLQYLTLCKSSLKERDMASLVAGLKHFSSLTSLNLNELKTIEKQTGETLALSLGSLIHLDRLWLPQGPGVAAAANLIIEQFHNLPKLSFLSMVDILDDESIALLADTAAKGYLIRLQSLELPANANITESGWTSFFERAGNMPVLSHLEMGRLYTQQIKCHATTVTAFVRFVSRLPSLVKIHMLGWLLDQDDLNMFNAMKENHPQAKSLHIFWQWLLPFSPNIEN
ncbi:baculoviral IAP repeat-containing protein 1e-like [Gastrophryne carolinensis]